LSRKKAAVELKSSTQPYFFLVLFYLPVYCFNKALALSLTGVA